MKNEIIVWHIVNSILAGALVLVGAIADGAISQTELIASLGAGGVIAITKFKEFWTKQEKSYHTMLFQFIH